MQLLNNLNGFLNIRLILRSDFLFNYQILNQIPLIHNGYLNKYGIDIIWAVML